jgi:hypothetical protein
MPPTVIRVNAHHALAVGFRVNAHNAFAVRLRQARTHTSDLFTLDVSAHKRIRCALDVSIFDLADGTFQVRVCLRMSKPRGGTLIRLPNSDDGEADQTIRMV